MIRGGTVVDAAGSRRPMSSIQDGIIATIGSKIELGAGGDGGPRRPGCVVAPGLVDLHTHLREPGREEAETVETGARAAALGGYTAVVAMPNTEPAIDCAAVVRQVLDLGADACCDVRGGRRHHRRPGRAASWRRWRRWPPWGCGSSPTTASGCRTPG